MKYLILSLAILLASIVAGLPVTHTNKNIQEESQEEKQFDVVLEYERYLKEIVETLETDVEFRKKLDKAPEADIKVEATTYGIHWARLGGDQTSLEELVAFGHNHVKIPTIPSGKIAQELEYVNHSIRSKLDEIKRREIGRLRSLASKQFEISNHIDRDHLKIVEHLNHENKRTFEVDDLEKLIRKTTHDLSEADKRRREEFKQYELQKEFEKQTALKEIKDEEARKQFEENLRKQKEKHNKHEQIHHPGNKAQLEEVWEKQDHMEGQEFDPKTFFMIHDVDGNGYWDETELKALFVKELDKVYQAGLPEDDLLERAEEMERMREHVFQESDTNRDRLISFQEFIEQTKREEFQRDPGWDTVDNVPQFTHEEYTEFREKKDKGNLTNR